MLLVTTSRQPVQAARALAKDLTKKLEAVFEERGGKSVEDLAEKARRQGASSIFIVTGGPESLRVHRIEVTETSWERKPGTVKASEQDFLEKLAENLEE